MKLLLCLLLLSVAAAVPASGQVAPGQFRSWKPADGAVAWTSDGVRIAIAPAPCDTPPRTEGCRWDPQNNQGQVRIESAGLAPFTVRTDGQSSFYRVAVVRFDAADPRPGIVIENQSGGSAGDVRVQLLLPSPAGYREAMLPGHLQGKLAETLTDLSGDGAVDFVLGDGRFAYVFGCGACTPRPRVVLTVRSGVPVDVSREAAYAAIFRADMVWLRARCLSAEPGRNGACAAYVADAARVGALRRAWREMLPHWERSGWLWQSCAVPRPAWTAGQCPSAHASRYRTFPQSLHAFLKRTGYIS